MISVCLSLYVYVLCQSSLLYVLLFFIFLQVVSQAVQYSIDEFVVELLVRMCEPHTANTHLAKYCR